MTIDELKTYTLIDIIDLLAFRANTFIQTVLVEETNQLNANRENNNTRIG